MCVDIALEPTHSGTGVRSLRVVTQTEHGQSNAGVCPMLRTAELMTELCDTNAIMKRMGSHLRPIPSASSQRKENSLHHNRQSHSPHQPPSSSRPSSSIVSSSDTLPREIRRRAGTARQRLLLGPAVLIRRQEDIAVILIKHHIRAPQERITQNRRGPADGRRAHEALARQGLPDELVVGDLDGQAAEGKIHAAGLLGGGAVHCQGAVVEDLGVEVLGEGSNDGLREVRHRGAGVEDDWEGRVGVGAAALAAGLRHADGVELEPIPPHARLALLDLGGKVGELEELAGELLGVDAPEDDGAAVADVLGA